MEDWKIAPKIVDIMEKTLSDRNHPEKQDASHIKKYTRRRRRPQKKQIFNGQSEPIYMATGTHSITACGSPRSHNY